MSEKVSRKLLFLFLFSAVNTEYELVKGCRLYGVLVKFLRLFCIEAF